MVNILSSCFYPIIPLKGRPSIVDPKINQRNAAPQAQTSARWLLVKRSHLLLKPCCNRECLRCHHIPCPGNTSIAGPWPTRRLPALGVVAESQERPAALETAPEGWRPPMAAPGRRGLREQRPPRDAAEGPGPTPTPGRPGSPGYAPTANWKLPPAVFSPIPRNTPAPLPAARRP